MVMNAPVEPAHQRRCCRQYRHRILFWTTECLQFAINTFTIVSKGKWLLVNGCKAIKKFLQRWKFENPYHRQTHHSTPGICCDVTKLYWNKWITFNATANFRIILWPKKPYLLASFVFFYLPGNFISNFSFLFILKFNKWYRIFCYGEY